MSGVIKLQKIIKKICIAGLITGLACYALLAALVAIPRDYEARPSDAILVLGHSVDYYNQPSAWLEARLEVALALYNQGMAQAIIVSGGHGPSDVISVAEAMGDWLIANGVPNSSIILESSSGSTYENFLYTQIITAELDMTSIIVVTNDFHMFRALRTASLFFDEISAQSAETRGGRIFAVMREPFSLIKLVFDHIIN